MFIAFLHWKQDNTVQRRRGCAGASVLGHQCTSGRCLLLHYWWEECPSVLVSYCTSGRSVPVHQWEECGGVIEWWTPPSSSPPSTTASCWRLRKYAQISQMAIQFSESSQFSGEVKWRGMTKNIALPHICLPTHWVTRQMGGESHPVIYRSI